MKPRRSRYMMLEGGAQAGGVPNEASAKHVHDSGGVTLAGLEVRQSGGQ